MELIYNNIFLEHDTGMHPENKKRLECLGPLKETEIEDGEEYLKLIHEEDYINRVKGACKKGAYLDPDTTTSPGSYAVATNAVGATVLASQLNGFAVVRPPGHHAEHKAFGGFCYFNSAAITAQYISPHGRVAVLDIDYHHGNGTQEIFYNRSDVVTVSIHGHPSFSYPYFSGFRDEKGEGEGKGCNLNVPLSENITMDQYREALTKALLKIIRMNCRFLIVALGLDTAKGDPTGTWPLLPKDFKVVGRMIGSLRLPTIVIQEGGYRIRSLGSNAKNFFTGLWEGGNLAFGRKQGA